VTSCTVTKTASVWNSSAQPGATASASTAPIVRVVEGLDGGSRVHLF
jgi:hypothetical protein